MTEATITLDVQTPDQTKALADQLAATQQVRDAVASLGNKLDALAAAIKAAPAPASGGGTTPTPPPPPPPVPTGPWPPASYTEGATITLPAGTFTGSSHVDKAGVTIKGAGMRRTIIDGQGGVGSGHRLAWGKGAIHAGAPLQVQDIGFVNGGGGDGKSDAEAGLYGEGFEGTLTALRCAFDKCEDGVFVPGPGLGDKIDLVLDRCVFGVQGQNGLADGRSHDLYVSGRSVTLRNCIFAGNSRGNIIKCRGPSLRVENCYVPRSSRWIDCPGGTDVVSRNNVYITPPGSNIQNALGFYDENDATANAGKFGSFDSDGDSFYFSRRIGEHIWIANAATVVTFKNTKVFWIGAPNSAPPVIIIDGPGKITGDNPFLVKLDESNRVDAAPPPPAEPTPA